MFKIIQVDSLRQIAHVAEIAHTVWNEHYGTILSQSQIDYMLGKFQSKEAIEQQIAEGYEYYLIVNQLNENNPNEDYTIDNRGIGYLSVKPGKDSDGLMKLFLSKLYILKEFRGRGAGSFVFEFLEQKARENSLKAIWLTVNKYNIESISVYKHRGYKTVRDQVADIGNGYVMDDYIMQKII